MYMYISGVLLKVGTNIYVGFWLWKCYDINFLIITPRKFAYQITITKKTRTFLSFFILNPKHGMMAIQKYCT